MSKSSQDLNEFLADSESNQSVSIGATPDNLDYKNLFGLFFAGIVLVAVMIYIAVIIFDYFSFNQSQRAAESAVYYQLETLRANDTEALNNFGIVDSESGVYSIPVDSAVTLVIQDYKN
jgi:hypothetical protein